MSHFTVLACLSPERIAEHKGDARAALTALFAPYDENKQVEPYRNYEKEEARDYWFAASLRRALPLWERIKADGVEAVFADLVATYTESNKGRPFLTERDAPENQAQADIEHAMFAGANNIGENPTWAQVVAAYNARYHSTADPTAVPDEEGIFEAEVVAVDGKPMIEATDLPLDENGNLDSERMFVDEEGRAYSWSQYNPDSKWDWYEIGGRWQRSLLALPDADETDLVFGAHGTFGDNGRPTHDEITRARWCDGLPRRLLDVERMRELAAADTLARYDEWQAIVAEHGEAVPWSVLMIRAKDGVITWDEAREVFNTQPAIVAAKKTDLMSDFGGDDPAEEYACTREEIEQRARNGAVPGYAMICADGRWMAPGKMGWWGASSDNTDDRAVYHAAASEYIDNLPGDTLLVMTDCHI